MTDKFDNGDVNAWQAYIRAFVGALEVDEKAIWIIGSKDSSRVVVAG
jgi:hypothetical protein